MSDFSPERLHSVLTGLLGTVSSCKLCVALSGGLDSVVLLHALAQLRGQQTGWQLRAIHVNHQLQTESAHWAELCVDWCVRLQVPCTVLRVQVDDIQHHGPEAAARKVRYRSMQAQLQSDEVLLTAHHADDQLETLLIALMRGAGLDGLAAMPTVISLGDARHARPLLGFTRNELQAWAAQQQLSYISDPSNEQTQFDRNYLRHEIIPRLKQRWPAAATTGTRSAGHLGEAQTLFDEYVQHDYLQAARANTLSMDRLQNWNSVRRRAVIRYWLQHNQVLMPSTRVLQALEHDMFNSAQDRVPCTRWGGYAVHRYQQHLYLEKHYVPEHLDDCLQWNWHEVLPLPHQLGSLCLAAPSNTASLCLSVANLPALLMVRFRQGGEQLQLPGERFHRELKKMLNDAGVLAVVAWPYSVGLCRRSVDCGRRIVGQRRVCRRWDTTGAAIAVVAARKLHFCTSIAASAPFCTPLANLLLQPLFQWVHCTFLILIPTAPWG